MASLRKVTFAPLSRNRYRCNQTGKIMTKGEILSYMMSLLAHDGEALRVAEERQRIVKKSAKPKK